MQPAGPERPEEISGRPLIALMIAFALGVAIEAVVSPVVVYGLFALGLAIVLTLLTRRGLWVRIALLTAFALLGSVRYHMATLRSSDDASYLAPVNITLTGVVDSEVDPPVGDTDRNGFSSVRCVLKAQRYMATALDGLPVWRPISGWVELRLPVGSRTAGAEVDKMPRYGDTLKVHGRLEVPTGARNPGGQDRQAYLARQGIYAVLTIHNPQSWELVEADALKGSRGNPVFGIAYALRRSVLQHIDAGFSAERAAVLNGVLLGARSGLKRDLQDAVERTGTAHILATAGLHVGLLVEGLLLTLRLCYLPRRSAVALTVSMLCFYAIMAGGRPSVVRACLVAGIYLLGIFLEREPNLPNTLALAALILLIYNPVNLFDAGFQLSFCTVAAIVLLMPLTEELRRGISKRVIGESGLKNWLKKGMRQGLRLLAACFFLAVTAQIGAAPLVAFYYNEISFVSIAANTLIVPIVALMLALGFVGVALGAVHPLLAWPIDLILNRLLAYTIWMIHACGSLPGASVSLPSPPLTFIVGYYAVILGLGWLWQRDALLSNRLIDQTEADDLENR